LREIAKTDSKDRGLREREERQRIERNSKDTGLRERGKTED
jgi:hypothetical protein